MNTNNVQKAAVSLAYALMRLYDARKTLTSLGYQITAKVEFGGRITSLIEGSRKKAIRAEGYCSRLVGKLAAKVQDDEHSTIQFALYGLESRYRAAGDDERARRSAPEQQTARDSKWCGVWGVGVGGVGVGGVVHAPSTITARSGAAPAALAVGTAPQ